MSGDRLTQCRWTTQRKFLALATTWTKSSKSTTTRITTRQQTRTDDEDYDQYQGEYDTGLDDSNEEESLDDSDEGGSYIGDREETEAPPDVQGETGEEGGAWPSEIDNDFADDVVTMEGFP